MRKRISKDKLDRLYDGEVIVIPITKETYIQAVNRTRQWAWRHKMKVSINKDYGYKQLTVKRVDDDL